MYILINIILTGIAVFIADFLIASVSLQGFLTAIAVGLVLGIVNAFIRPLVILLTLPINILTLGLFTFVINALLVMLVASIVPGFAVSGFWAALLFSLVVSVLKMIFNKVAHSK
ncbi:MAG: phage holin family protein [Candidatus Doudnabacteria bacterium]|nr:phage holin family protein [Candidatus Doudnabacteria bacterium]